ncbi:MAG: hypothetical protein HGA80_00950 [Candidatus Omnitrophica bacterium]|nr:hypothetical protein [Candidatus Omnitrophota bacterium]
MTRDEIYDHLAKVYLGKRESAVELKSSGNKSHVWLVINIVTTAFILASIVYGLTAFFAKRNDELKSRIIYALNNSPIRLAYAVGGEYPQVKDLTIEMPRVDVSKFTRMNLSMKGQEGGSPGVIKVVLTNDKLERASYYLQGIKERWQEYSVSFEELNLTDWKTLKEISFVVEAWNADKPKGAVFIDNIGFSN